MITKYVMAVGNSTAALEEDVNRLINAGYQPYGELKAEWSSDGYKKTLHWLLPMVKEDVE